MTRIIRKQSQTIRQGVIEVRIPRMAEVYKWDLEDGYNGTCLRCWFLVPNDYDSRDVVKVKVYVAMQNDKISPEIIIDRYLTSDERFLVLACV